MTINFSNVKLTKEEIEKIILWKVIFGSVDIKCTHSGVTLTVDGRDHLWRRKNLKDNFLYTLLESKSDKVAIK